MSYPDQVLFAAFALSSVLLVLELELAPREADFSVTVIFSPWTSSGKAINGIVKAGATLLSVGRLPFVVVVKPDGANFTDRVTEEGAWIVSRPFSLMGCHAPGTKA